MLQGLEENMNLAIELRTRDWSDRPAVRQVIPMMGGEPEPGILGALLSEDQMAEARQLLEQLEVPYKCQLTEKSDRMRCNGADW